MYIKSEPYVNARPKRWMCVEEVEIQPAIRFVYLFHALEDSVGAASSACEAELKGSAGLTRVLSVDRSKPLLRASGQ